MVALNRWLALEIVEERILPASEIPEGRGNDASYFNEWPAPEMTAD